MDTKLKNEFVDEAVSQHDTHKPFAPENGKPLRFKVGDSVIYTNDYGLEFEYTITGLVNPPSAKCGLYARLYAGGSRYYVDSDSPWVAIQESSLRPA